MTWTLTHSGTVMNLMEPRPEMVKLGDIAVHLSRIARFSGATDDFYSVADHSVFVALIIKDLRGSVEQQIAGLFHDAHEAYIGDIPTPVKFALGDQASIAIEDLKRRLDIEIFDAMDVRWDDETALMVKHADAVALATERQCFMPASGPRWPLKATATERTPYISKTPAEAEFNFRTHHWQLCAMLNRSDEDLSVGEIA
jgi:5'-nucleotidase